MNQMPIPEPIIVAREPEHSVVRPRSRADHGDETMSIEPHGLRVREEWSPKEMEELLAENGS